MARILFVTWDGGGNLPPALAIATSLRDGGHEVRFLGHRQQCETISAAGLRCDGYRHARPWSATEAASPSAVPYRGGRDRGARIEGMARLCRSDGGPDDFTISGDTGNWRGTVFRLEASAVKRAPGTYTHLGGLDGEWDGGDTIRLCATPYPVVINADGGATVTGDTRSPYPQVTFELRRAEGDQSEPFECPSPPAASTA